MLARARAAGHTKLWCVRMQHLWVLMPANELAVAAAEREFGPVPGLRSLGTFMKFEVSTSNYTVGGAFGDTFLI